MSYWYLARATGAVSLVLLTIAVVLGVLGAVRFSVAPRWPRFTIDMLHRDVSLLVVVLLAAHIATSVLDGFAPIRLVNAVIPFGGTYRPLWLGLGAFAFDLLIAVAVTSAIRRRLGYRAWRAIHWLAYASWPVALLHGLGAGSDTKTWWMLALTAACTMAVLAAVCTRIFKQPVARRGPALAATLLTPLGLGIFTLAGPLQRGWARRAGTPATLLAKRASQTVNTRFSARLAGTLSQSKAPGGAVVDLALQMIGSVRGRLRIRLAGAPLAGGGLSLTGSQVDLSALGLPSVMQGTIISLQGQQFVARVTGGSGSALDLRADLSIDRQSGVVNGTLAASPPGPRR